MAVRRHGGIIWETAAIAHLGVTDSRGRCAAGVAMEEVVLRDTLVNQLGGTGAEAL